MNALRFRLRHWRRRGPRRFILLCYRRTGSNLISGMLFNHPEILMHNEIFNENAVHSYYKKQVLDAHWDYEGRDGNPARFAQFMLDKFHERVPKFREDGAKPADCKAVGFKWFPNHAMQHGVLIARVQAVFEQLMADSTVHKIILTRENVAATYVSSRRSEETGYFLAEKYDDHRITVDVAHMQQFIDRFIKDYADYDQWTQGQPTCRVSYEQLTAQRGETMQRIVRFLHVSEDEALAPLKECVQQSSGGPLEDAITNYSDVEFAYRHTDLARYLPPSQRAVEPSNHAVESPTFLAPSRWALLFPVRSNSGPQQCVQQLQVVCDALRETARPTRDDLLLVFGVDDDDEVYRDGTLIRSVFDGFEVVLQVLKRDSFQGKICKIWNELAKVAYTEHRADFTLLLGDDVILKTPGWQDAIENIFEEISRERSLPFGAACVAFYDEAFRGFPTFPVLHRWHFEAHGHLLPHQFENQGGDPFLFELYKHFGASRFALDQRLHNTIGGKQDDTRYTKQRLRFESDILTRALGHTNEALDRAMGCKVKQLISMDVVVPTYRCDIAALRRITQLRASYPVAVSFWIILDNPTHPKAAEVEAMQTVAQNYQINVRSLGMNCGASAARNFGLGHSLADWVVLLDDDVTPEPQLLDAYLGAAQRWPKAGVLVGSTHLPPPTNWLTHAIVASDIPGAYTIAERRAEPPWGVTANLCVRGRDRRLRFDLRYPKTGGGEDLDFCAQARHCRPHGCIMAVPGARADHPWWNGGGPRAILHVLAWADGEVMCAGVPWMREHVFWTVPNGVEIVILLLLLGLVALALGMVTVLSLVTVPIPILTFEMLCHASYIGPRRIKPPVSDSAWRSVALRLTAAALIMLQDGARFFAVVKSCHISWFFWRVDWHFGQISHFADQKRRGHAVRAMLYVIGVIVWWRHSEAGACTPLNGV